MVEQKPRNQLKVVRLFESWQRVGSSGKQTTYRRRNRNEIHSGRNFVQPLDV